MDKVKVERRKHDQCEGGVFWVEVLLAASIDDFTEPLLDVEDVEHVRPPLVPND
jgi:hypothetical protein